jgi:hypothetical protein
MTLSRQLSRNSYLLKGIKRRSSIANLTQNGLRNMGFTGVNTISSSIIKVRLLPT